MIRAPHFTNAVAPAPPAASDTALVTPVAPHGATAAAPGPGLTGRRGNAFNHPLLGAYLSTRRGGPTLAALGGPKALRQRFQAPPASTAPPSLLADLPETPQQVWRQRRQEIALRFSTASYDVGKMPGVLGAHAREAAIHIGLQSMSAAVSNAIMAYVAPGDGTAQTSLPDTLTKTVLHNVIGMAGNLRAVLEQGRRNDKESEIAIYTALRDEWRDHVAQLPPYLRAAIGRVDDYFSDGERTDHHFTKVGELLDDRLKLMSVPQHAKDVGCRLTPEKCAVIDAREAALLAGQPEGNRKVFANLLMQIRDNSALSDGEGYPAQVYIQGPPGTGKTTLAEAVGATLGLPSKTIPVNQLGRDMRLEDAVADAIIECGITNPIIILDDVGGFLNDRGGIDELNRFFNPEQATRYCAKLGIDIDMRKVTFLCTGNPPLANAALISRLPQIALPRLDREQKESVARKAYDAKLAELAEILPPRQLRRIAAEAESYREAVIELDLRTNPGGRVLDAVIRNQLFGLVRQALDSATPPSREQMLADIDAAFRRSTTAADGAEPTFEAPATAPAAPAKPAVARYGSTAATMGLGLAGRRGNGFNHPLLGPYLSTRRGDKTLAALGGAEAVRQRFQTFTSTALESFLTDMPEPPQRAWNKRREEISLRFATASYDLAKLPGVLGGHAREAAVRIGLQVISNMLTTAIMDYFAQGDGAAQKDLPAMLANSVLHTVIGMASNLRAVLEQGKRTDREGEIATYIALREETRDHVAQLPPYLRAAISRVDDYFSEGERTGHHFTKVGGLLDDRLKLMSVPQHAKDVGCYRMPEKSAFIDARGKALLAGQPEDNRKVFANLLMQIRDNSALSEGKGYPAQVYIQGPPGTGKTTLAEAVGATLGLPSKTIRVNQLGPNMRLEDAVADAIIESGITNPIIILDDVGSFLNNHGGIDELNRFFNPEQVTRHCGKLGIDIDMRKVTFLCTGNPPITNEALISRLPQIALPRLDREQKDSVARKAYDAKLAELAKILPPEQVRRIAAEAESYREAVIELDLRTNPGGRVLDAVIRNQLFGLVRQALDSATPPSREQMLEEIDAAFQRSITAADDDAAPFGASFIPPPGFGGGFLPDSPVGWGGGFIPLMPE